MNFNLVTLLAALNFANPAFGTTSLCVSHLIGGDARSLAQVKGSSAIPVTGALQYPLPYVLANLGLSDWTPESWKDVALVTSQPKLILSEGLSAEGSMTELRPKFPQKGARVLSLGEGRSDFIPFTLRQGLEGVAQDPVNDLGEHGKTAAKDPYVGQFYRSIVGGTAADLSRFADDSQQLVVSHALLSHLSRADRVAAIREGFRVLAPGGSSRHSMLIRQPGESVTGFGEDFESQVASGVSGLVKEALGEAGTYDLSVFIDTPSMELSEWEPVSLDLLFNRELNKVKSYQHLRAKLAPLQKPALNVLVVLSKPDGSWSRWIFGR